MNCVRVVDNFNSRDIFIFANALREHVTAKETVRGIPKGQRLIGRASLKKVFDKAGKEKATRDRLIPQAVTSTGTVKWKSRVT